MMKLKELECGPMAAQLNVGGALCESSIMPFLVPRHKVWLTTAARVPCSNVGNIGEQDLDAKQTLHLAIFHYGATAPEVNIQCTSPGDGQTSRKVWLASVERNRCTNEAKTRNPLKFAGVPQINEQISAASRPKFTI